MKTFHTCLFYFLQKYCHSQGGDGSVPWLDSERDWENIYTPGANYLHWSLSKNCQYSNLKENINLFSYFPVPGRYFGANLPGKAFNQLKRTWKIFQDPSCSQRKPP